jgi:hypothetical protein
MRLWVYHRVEALAARGTAILAVIWSLSMFHAALAGVRVRSGSPKSGIGVTWNGIAFELPFTRAKANPILIAEKEVHTENTEIGSQRARRYTALFSVTSVCSP